MQADAERQPGSQRRAASRHGGTPADRHEGEEGERSSHPYGNVALIGACRIAGQRQAFGQGIDQ